MNSVGILSKLAPLASQTNDHYFISQGSSFEYPKAKVLAIPIYILGGGTPSQGPYILGFDTMC